jgi:hypothetical protein
MEEIEAPVGKDHRFAFRPPAAPLFEKFRATVERSHRFSVASQLRKKTGTFRPAIAYN